MTVDFCRRQGLVFFYVYEMPPGRQASLKNYLPWSKFLLAPAERLFSTLVASYCNSLSVVVPILVYFGAGRPALL